MEASMRVAGWADLAFPIDEVAGLVEEHASGDDLARLEAALREAPSIPPGFAHHGVGGDALRAALAEMLGLPAVARASSLTFVPFAIGGPHRHTEGGRVHLLVGAEALRSAWPATRDAAYAEAVADAVRAVRRGAPSALEHLLWLEHFLVEQLLPLGARLALPVRITWPDHEATSSEELEARLDAALESWEDR